MMGTEGLRNCSGFVVGFSRHTRKIMEAGFRRIKAETLENQGCRQTFKGWKMVGVMGFEATPDGGYCVSSEPFGKYCSCSEVDSAWFIEHGRELFWLGKSYIGALEGVNG